MTDNQQKILEFMEEGETSEFWILRYKADDVMTVHEFFEAYNSLVLQGILKQKDGGKIERTYKEVQHDTE